MDKAAIAQEFIKCKNSYLYFISNYLKVAEPGTGDMKYLKPYDCQMKFINAWDYIQKDDNKKSGILFMASRQCGKTTLVEALITWLVVFHENYCVVVMNRDESLGKQNIVEIKDMIDSIPEWMNPGYTNPTHQKLITLKNKSTIHLEISSVSADKKSSKGRGLRPLLIWIDEAAFVPLQHHIKAMIPATSETFRVAKEKNIPHGVIFTSTPNGKTGSGEGFYNYWVGACDEFNDSSYMPVKIHWREIPNRTDDWYKEQCGLLGNNQRDINQELELLFVGGNDSVLTDDIIKDLQDDSLSIEPISKEDLGTGYIAWWEMPSPKKQYIIGIDTATESGTDFSTIQVFDRISFDQVAECKIKCKIPFFTSEIIPKVIDVLPNKLLVIEKNGVGRETIDNLEPRYGRYMIKDTYTDKDSLAFGLTMTNIVRSLLIDEVLSFAKEYRHHLKSKSLRLELSSLERKRSGRIEGSPNDDLVFAMGFCLFAMSFYSDISSYYNKIYGDDENNPLDMIDVMNDADDMGIMGLYDEETKNNIAMYAYIKSLGKHGRNGSNNNQIDELISNM